MGWGSSTQRGGGQKVRALPRKFVFLGFGREEPGMSREFCRDVPDPWTLSQARKKNPNLNFSVRIFSGGVVVFHVKGWGPKSSVCPSKPREFNFFGGISRDFAAISRKRPKSLRKKSLGSILVPYLGVFKKLVQKSLSAFVVPYYCVRVWVCAT